MFTYLQQKTQVASIPTLLKSAHKSVCALQVNVSSLSIIWALSLHDIHLNTVFRILLGQNFISREHFNKVAFYQLNIPNQSSYKSWPLSPSVQA